MAFRAEVVNESSQQNTPQHTHCECLIGANLERGLDREGVHARVRKGVRRHLSRVPPVPAAPQGSDASHCCRRVGASASTAACQSRLLKQKVLPGVSCLMKDYVETRSACRVSTVGTLASA